MDTSAITLMIVLAGGIIYVSGMYLYRRATAGEKFDLQKYAQTFGYVGLLAVAAYLATGAIPDFDAILTQITNGMPDSAAIMSAVSAIILGILHQVTKSSTSTSTTSTATAQTATTEQAKSTLAATATVTPAVENTITSVETVTPVQESWIANANGTVTNSRTGRTYVNIAVGTADELALAKENNTVAKHTVVTPNGKTFSTSFSQYWEDPAYQISLYGIPTPAIIAAYTDAAYAYAVAQYTLGKTTTAPAAPTVTA